MAKTVHRGSPATLDRQQAAAGADQSRADADQTLSDADQTQSDADQTLAGGEQALADRDQRASDQDQASADREHAAQPHPSKAEQGAYKASLKQRATESTERVASRLARSRIATDRDTNARRRDRVARSRDDAGLARDASAALLPAEFGDGPQARLLKEFEAFRATAARDRARAAADRERAARDRATAARERARLEAELESAHLDELTGAYRREMGGLTLSHEIDRARRSDGRFVLAFVDVDDLKVVNDRDGHAAGDRVLQVVADAIRARLRSFDPIIRHGGDEFVCGLGAVDLPEAAHRFDLISKAIATEANVEISVGLAVLATDDTLEALTARADRAMLKVKARHHAGR